MVAGSRPASSSAICWVATMLPPWLFETSTSRKPCRVSASTRSCRIARKVAWPTVSVPPKAMWCSERPLQTTGATTTGRVGYAIRAARMATSWPSAVSVITGRCGPCCSIEATGRMTAAPRSASARNSCALRRAHSTSAMLPSTRPDRLRPVRRQMAAWRGGAQVPWRGLSTPGAEARAVEVARLPGQPRHLLPQTEIDRLRQCLAEVGPCQADVPEHAVVVPVQDLAHLAAALQIPTVARRDVPDELQHGGSPWCRRRDAASEPEHGIGEAIRKTKRLDDSVQQTLWFVPMNQMFRTPAPSATLDIDVLRSVVAIAEGG